MGHWNMIQDKFYWQSIRVLVGSLECFGNPRLIFKQMLSAVKHVVCEPYKGAMKSPEDMLEGVVRGADSIGRCTVAGTCTVIAGVMGALVRMIDVLGFDDKYQGNRRRAIQPTNAKDGCRLCFRGLYRGYGQGCSGICHSATIGHRRNGRCGACFGTCKGIAGCFVVPLMSTLEGVRLLSKGIRNSMTGEYERAVRKRPPRMLYGHEHVMRTYNQSHADLKKTLTEIDEGLGMLAIIDMVVDDGTETVAIVSDTLFLHVNTTLKTILLNERLQDIAEVSVMSPVQVSLRMHPTRKLDNDKNAIFFEASENSTTYAVAKILESMISVP